MIRVVAGVVLRRGRLLACQRSASQFPPNAWEFPGGKVEPGESDEAALARELAEELGIRVVVGGHVGTNVHHYGTKAIELVAYAASIEVGEPVAHEHQAVRWIGLDELRELDWAPADIPLLDPIATLLAQMADMP